MIEKTKKYLVKKIPNLTGLVKTSYERYFLFKSEKVELRIQRKNQLFELERVENNEDKSTNKTKVQISEEEFESLKKNAIGKIVRDSYTIQDNPEIVIRFYKDLYVGLVRAETEMEIVPEWFGKEITQEVLGRDGKLMRLSKTEFQEVLTNCTK